MYNNTIVSAFLSDVNKRKDLNIENYINNGKYLLKAKIPKIIFVDDIVYEKLLDCENEYTKIIKYNKDESYLFQLKDIIDNFNINSSNFEKDTLDYILTMCMKTEWMKIAINKNIFNTNNFIWIDFGIKYIMKNLTDEEFVCKIENFNSKSYDKVRVASIWKLDSIYNIDVYKNIMWFFAGGIFGGDREKLLLFSKKVKEECVKIISERHSIMWEVNIWYIVYKNNPELFDYYYSNHNISMLDLY